MASRSNILSTEADGSESLFIGYAVEAGDASSHKDYAAFKQAVLGKIQRDRCRCSSHISW